MQTHPGHARRHGFLRADHLRQVALKLRESHRPLTLRDRLRSEKKRTELRGRLTLPTAQPATHRRSRDALRFRHGLKRHATTQRRSDTRRAIAELAHERPNLAAARKSGRARGKAPYRGSTGIDLLG